MSRHDGIEIMPGAVLEFYDSKEILCGIVLSVKESRCNVLSECNREVSLTPARIVFHGKTSFDVNLGRDELVHKLTAVSEIRRKIMDTIDLKDVWSLLESEETGYQSGEIAEFIFSTPISEDRVAAVNRLLVSDRLYFQDKDSRFYARSAQSIETRRLESQREAEKERRLLEAASWVSAVHSRKQNIPTIESGERLIQELKDFALFGKDAKEGAFIKELFKLAAIPPTPLSAFRVLVRTGVWQEDENLMLHEHGISPVFPPDVLEEAEVIAKRTGQVEGAGNKREDFTGLDTFTVDSPLTRDYDDALSVRALENGLFEVGIHIADAAEFIRHGTALDREAAARASSIYLPEDRLSMLPPSLSEGVLSLQAGRDRMAMSFLITMDSEANVFETRICSSIIRVRRQLTYQDVDKGVHEDSGLKSLFELALKLRQKRLESGAIILPLPEIQVYVNTVGMIQIVRYDKETPSQIMVSEWMIAANAAAADYFVKRSIPALFRNQAECRPETEFAQSEHELFRIYRQRRLFSRAELATEAKPHCSLAVAHYTTVTSPIRRYSDLVVQRQLKNALAVGAGFYSEDQMDEIGVRLSATQATVSTIQRKWSRYWILKYMEQEDLQELNALVLDKNSRFAHLLIPDFLLEANAPLSETPKFDQGDMVKLRVEKVLPREDVLKVQIL
jgi:exoribonuclease-2